ncbi:hypothetical protein KVH27_27925 [Streptomyces olivaceus]|uniref:hypothetical protein n=1 Tax=Streptomyces olivaceus TaxID=47716 RepID=UPI001CCA1923|nr:hypothetical protein [Streptomyces olivaceus]MBZ6252180.1 hypothetical protein [Streptomyces olivaceus]
MEPLNQWTPLPPKQAETHDGYGTRTGGLVTVAGDRWSCSGCGKSEAASDAHHAAQYHAAECLSVGFTSKEN